MLLTFKTRIAKLLKLVRADHHMAYGFQLFTSSMVSFLVLSSFIFYSMVS